MESGIFRNFCGYIDIKLIVEFSSRLSWSVHQFAVSSGNGGSVVPSGYVAAIYGGSQTFTISAGTGYHVVDVLVNGTSVGAVSSCTVQNIQGATTISATFAPNPTPTPSPSPSPTLDPTSQPT